MSNFVPKYTADGHTVDVVLESGGYSMKFECPGEGKCRAAITDQEGKPRVPFECNLKLWVEDAGMEFLEWQVVPYRTVVMPCRVAWYFDGWDDSAELHWRPDVGYTVEEVVEIAYLSAGAASAPFMQAMPDFVMPTEEIDRGVTGILREKGL